MTATPKEIAIMALHHEKPPRVPVTLIAGGEWYVHLAGKTFSEIRGRAGEIAEVYINAYRQVGHCLIWTGAGLLNYPAHFLGCPIEEEGSKTPALQGPAIHSLDDIGALEIEKVLEDPDMRAIIDGQHLVADEIGDETLILPTQWGPFTTAARLLGTESLMLATIENPEKLLELIRFTTELNWAVGSRLMAHRNIAGFNLSEPVASGDMVSPCTFRRFVAPFLADLAGRVRDMGKYVMVHVCGNSTPILADILEIRPHSFSLEAKVDLREAKSVLGGRICITGNVSPTGAFLSGTPEEVTEEAKACLQTWGDDGGFILSVGCDFPKEVPLANAKALMSL